MSSSISRLAFSMAAFLLEEPIRGILKKPKRLRKLLSCTVRAEGKSSVRRPPQAAQARAARKAPLATRQRWRDGRRLTETPISSTPGPRNGGDLARTAHKRSTFELVFIFRTLAPSEKKSQRSSSSSSLSCPPGKTPSPEGNLKGKGAKEEARAAVIQQQAKEAKSCWCHSYSVSYKYR